MTHPIGCPLIANATHFTVRTTRSLRGILLVLVLFTGPVPTQATEVPSRMARGYLTLLDTACVYVSLVPGRPPVEAAGDPGAVTVGKWTVRRGEGAKIDLMPVSHSDAASR